MAHGTLCHISAGHGATSGQPPRPGTTRYASCTAGSALFGSASAQDVSKRRWLSYRVNTGAEGLVVDNRVPRTPLARQRGRRRRRGAGEVVGQVERRASEDALSAGHDRVAVDDAPHAEPWVLAKPSTGASGMPRLREPAAMARAIGCSEASSTRRPTAGLH
jgi:hypothetical protein